MYPIPIHPVRSHAVLPPGAVEVLFGGGYRLRGNERVEVVALGRPVAEAEVRPGPALRLVLDAAARAAAPGAPLRLVGPKGVVGDVPAAEPIRPTLLLPRGLLDAWRLAPGQRVALRVGRLALIDVPVEEGSGIALSVDPAVLLAGEVEAGDVAFWLPDAGLASEQPETTVREAAPAGVVTENDVRQARRRRETIRLAPGQKITPAARALGRELGVLEEGVGP